MLLTTVSHAELTIDLEVYDPASSSSGTTHSWLWMSRYRVWEGDVKVYLYPENWLENTNSTSGSGCGNTNDAIFCRRPDIAELDLTVENNNVELPYVDLTSITIYDRLITIPKDWFSNHDSYVIQDCSLCNFGLSVTVQDIPSSGVPEPATYAMLLLGIGILSLAAKRRE